MHDDKFLQAITRAAEINALSIARQGKPTCLLCGLFATLTLKITYFGGEAKDAAMHYYTRPGQEDEGCYVEPHFCDSCQPELKPHWKLEPVEGAPVARRLNKLLRALADT